MLGLMGHDAVETPGATRLGCGFGRGLGVGFGCGLVVGLVVGFGVGVGADGWVDVTWGTGFRPFAGVSTTGITGADGTVL